MVEKRQQTVYVHRDSPIYDWCDHITSCACNLKNATRFRQRQVYFARRKKGELHENEQAVLEEMKSVTGHDVLAENTSLTYKFLYHLMQDSHNPDYYAENFPAQTAQHVIKQCVTEFKSYYASFTEWLKNPESFTGKPEIPGYARKGGRVTAVVTNQDCTLSVDKNGATWAHMPRAKKIPVCLGVPKGKFKELKVVPTNGIFKLCFLFDVEYPDVVLPEVSERIAAIDFGVDNIMSVTNNIGEACLLYKGGIVKSENRFYNKRLAEVMAKEMSKPDCPKNRKGEPRFVPTEESQALTTERNNRVHDFMLKAACHFIAWCVEKRIDTIVLGVNHGWKQDVCIGKKNNQNFVQIPFSYLQSVIKYKAAEHGILVVEQEESYTSKASFLDNDDIPVYKKGVEAKYVFSGRRRPTRYKGMYKKDGFRGLYRSKDGTIINSDLNGSANILRKAFPDAFKNQKPDFNNVTIIKNPEYEFVVANEIAQAYLKRPTIISKSKAKRIERKLTA